MPLLKTPLMDTDDLYVPDYDYNIYKVLPTALRCMGVQVPRPDLFEHPEIRNHLKTNDALKVQRVIVCIVDSLGIQNIKDTTLGTLFEDFGGITLSSTFPTITSAAITSLYHGVPPTTHGILGYRIYFREYGTVVDTLRMSGHGIRARNAIPRAGINVRTLIWSTPIADLLHQQSDSSLIYADGYPGHIAGTGLGHFFTHHSDIVPYTDYIDAFGMTRRVLNQYAADPLFVTLYFGIIDVFAHKYGPFSPEYQEGCDTFLRHLRAFTESLSPAVAKQTTIILCSDHGQNPIQAKRRIIFTQEHLEEVKGTLRVPPGNSGRVMHFYCAGARKQRLLKAWLKEQVDDRAVIFDVKDVMNSQLLPVPITRKITERLGDLLLICRDGANVEVERNRYEGEQWGLLPTPIFLGSHGSITADELYTPFLAFNAQNLR